MRQLTEDGRRAAQAIARRHGVGDDAAVALLHALERGGGTQAQFSHPDLGGMGQWSRHGMIMVGDMFNHGLKARVDALCSELSALMADRALFTPETGAFGAGASGNAWWPEGCGTPGAAGSANDTRYAFFPETRRLAILRDGRVELYDTGDQHIHGVSSQQQNGGAADLTFTSQHGTVRLHELTRVGEAAPASQPAGASPAATARPGDTDARDRPQAPGAGSEDDIFAKIERLHELQVKGVLSETDVADKKKELLARL